jgi:hypothetical protein
VIPVDVDSGIFHGQPWGHQATYEGMMRPQIFFLFFSPPSFGLV